MKLIALMPVRNEERVLPTTLACLEQFCDHIVVSDHRSTDRTREIAHGFSKVVLIDNSTPENGPEFGQPMLFDAARQFEGNNLLLCIDADELPPPSIFRNLKAIVAENYAPGTFFSLWWVQLWRSIYYYRDDESVWSNSYKPLMLFDDRHHNDWSERHLHAGRLPNLTDSSRLVTLEGFPILHLQWAYWDRTQFKQAHYRMLEFILADFTNAAGINQKYAVTLGDEKEGLKPVPDEWLDGLDIPTNLVDVQPCWQYDDILVMFEEHGGVERFEPLQIWHIPELHRLFVGATGREPVPATAPEEAPPGGVRQVAKRVLPPSAVRLLRHLMRR